MPAVCLLQARLEASDVGFLVGEAHPRGGGLVGGGQVGVPKRRPALRRLLLCGVGIMATDLVGWLTRLLWDRYEMVKSKKLLACWVTVGPLSGVWGSCGLCATVRLVSSNTQQGGEEGVWHIGRVVLLDGEGQGQECHEGVQEGPSGPHPGGPRRLAPGRA